MRIHAALVVPASAIAIGAGTARAGDGTGAPSPPAREEVDRWLSELGSERFEVREAARRRLQAVAASVREALVARRDDPDPEVRRTVRALLEGLGGDETSPATPSPGVRAV